MNTIVIKNLSDINLKHVFECGQCFRWNDEAGDGSYIGIASGYVCRATIITDNDNCNGGDASEGEKESNTVDLKLEVTGGGEDFWRDYFDLQTDYGAVKRELLSCDLGLAPAIDAGYGIRILRQDYFEILISFIISQNNNIPRIKGCIESMCREFGEPLGEHFGRERYAFPTPEKTATCSPDDFARLRFGYRSSYLPEAARRYMDEGRPGGGSPEQRGKLLSYLGIGPKVANCIMLFGLRDIASFPIDTWIRKYMADTYGFDQKDIRGMQRFAEERFGCYGGIAQQYIFYYNRG